MRALLALLVLCLTSAAAFAQPIQPPGPQPVTCAGGQFFSAYPSYGQKPTCGAGVATGTINSGGAQALAIYPGASPGTTLGPATLASYFHLSGGALTLVNLPASTFATGAAASNIGTLGGVLGGTLPNPSMASGAAATNVGSLGGVLGGSLPNPTMASGAAASNVGSLGSDLSGTLPNPLVAKLQGNGVCSGATPTTNQLMGWSGTCWGPVNAPTSGINQLTGDVTSGPGTGSQSATLAASGVTAGTYTVSDGSSQFCWTIDVKGRVTGIASGACGGSVTLVARNGSGTTVARNGGGSVERN